jgi:hypothetical protein
MDNQRHADAGDDFQADVSDLGQPTVSTPPALEPRLTPRRRAVRLAGTLGVLFVALLVILASVPAVRDRAMALAFPTPTPALAPGADLFYLPVNPRGIIVLLDGYPLAHVPVPNDPHPLRLARGRHQLEWRGGAFPFLPRQCVVSVPHADADTCPFISTGISSSITSAPVIGLQVSLLALPSDQRSALLGATQAALAASGSSAIVQPGEFYFSPASESSFGLPKPILAAQPLRATLDLQLNPLTEESAEPCFVENALEPCRFPGQMCQIWCTLPSDVIPGTGTTPVWIAAAMVLSSWNFTTLSGKAVASNQQEFPTNLFLIVLRITRDGTHWHVAPVFGHTPGLPITDDLLCGPARGWVMTGQVGFLFNSLGGEIEYASGTIASDGCAVVDTGYVGNPPTYLPPPALFLERFGVLLAANDAAHTLWPDLPRADASEQALAQQLAAQLGP